jgi:hypothetical protein
MKIRFPTDRRASWRRHFLEIARQAAACAAPDLSIASGWRRPRVQGSGMPQRLRNADFAR